MAKLIILAAAVIFEAFVVQSETEFTIMPDVKELLLKEGAQQDLNCYVKATDQLTLNWSFPLVGDNEKEWYHHRMQASKSGNTFTVNSTLQILKFDAAHAGEYKCGLVKDERTIEQKVIVLTAVKEVKTNATYVKGLPASLACSISFASNWNVSNVTWLKGIYEKNNIQYKPVSQLTDSKRFQEISDNNSLIISSPEPDDAGLYIARFKFADSAQSYDCEVEFQAEPMVQEFDKAKNLIEGDKLDLQCKVKGHPHSKVTWYKGNDLLNITGENSRHVVQESLDGHQTIRLVIESVEFSDAGEYTCEAYSERFNETSRKTLTVRVKDKLAALWPFLGIVGEVVVLCTIIFIYEKRRNRQVQLEEKAAEEVDGSNTDKKEGLRHRNPNNPSA